MEKIKKPQSYKELTYQKLKQAIITHVFYPGEMLSERDLSEQLGISRTPLREALLQLELEGWLCSIPRKGIIISVIREKDVIETMQIRLALELLVVDLLIPVIKDEHIKDIEQRFFLPLQEEEIFEINAGGDLHIYMAELCGNERLLRLLQLYSDQIKWYGTSALSLPGRLNEVMEEHKAILDGLKTKNVNATKEGVIRHIMNTQQAILQTLKM